MAEKDQAMTMHEVAPEAKTSAHDIDTEKIERHGSVYAAEVKASDFKMDAIEAEKLEHQMGVLQAVRMYPMATFWAVVMSSMIVSGLFELIAGN